MFGDSIAIPAVRIGPVATEVASTAKSVAAVLFFFVAVFVFAAVGMAVDGIDGGKNDSSSTIVGVLFWLVLIASFAMRFVKTARRATAAVARAKADPQSMWFLSGKMIVGSDTSGAPSPELTFKISGKLRTMLLAVPKATVIEHS